MGIRILIPNLPIEDQVEGMKLFSASPFRDTGGSFFPDMETQNDQVICYHQQRITQHLHFLLV